MQNILVVDDLRTFDFNEKVLGERNVVYARNVEEAISIISSRYWDELWLDHDLGKEEDIMPFVDYLIENRKQFVDIGMIFCHSGNPVGRRNCFYKLEKWFMEVYEVDLNDRIHSAYMSVGIDHHNLL